MVELNENLERCKETFLHKETFNHSTIQSEKNFFSGFNPPPGGPGGQGGDVTAQDQEKVHQHQISFLVLNATSFIYWGYYPVSLATYLVFFCSSKWAEFCWKIKTEYLPI